MEAELSTALMLLLTGMITVFTVLLLVVITGNLLIRFVNAFIPELVIPAEKQGDQVNKKKIAAINAAVEIITKGQGRVSKIERKK